MITHHIGKAEIEAYCLDLVDRLVGLGTGFPKTFFFIGESGRKLGLELMRLLGEDRLQGVAVDILYMDRATGEITSSFTFPEGGLTGPVLLIDSAVHSGRSMLACARYLRGQGATSIVTYSLILKRASDVVPTYFGLLIDDTDRVLFDLERLPNNRQNSLPPFGILRMIQDDDIHLEMETVGAPFEDLSAGGLLYDRAVHGLRPYVYELDGRIAGHVSFAKRGSVLFVDSWGVSQARRDAKIGGALIRWAENWGRSSRCDRIELWAYEEAFERYERMGYEYIPGREMRLSAKQHFKLMTRKLLYHTYGEFKAEGAG